MNKGISIKARIGLTMGFLAALIVAISAVGLLGLTRSNDAYRDTFTNQMPSSHAVNLAEIYAARERLALDRAAFQLGTPDAADTLARARMLRGVSDDFWKKYMALPRGPQEQRLAQEVMTRRDELHQIADRFAATVTSGDQARVLEGAKALKAAYDELSKADAALDKLQMDQAQQGFDDAQSAFAQLRITVIAALLVGIGAAVFSFLSLRRAIAEPLGEALGAFQAIAAGDLRRPVTVRRRDEMGELLGGVAQMQRSLTETVRSVRSGTESIATATRQIAAGNTDLSSRTEEQASALQETASSMEELTGTVRQNADNARQASALAANASEIANKGNAVVNQVVGTMGDINQSSAKIAEIITIIEGIAFQTNILALNAAVEAARAGEEGRGFAVVAGEVRSLAQRSSAAAKEIKGLIDTSVERVHAGSALVDEAGRTMTEIIGAVRRVTDIMGEIAAASQEQSGGIEQVARAVTQMDEVTQQNAALVEEAAAAAQSLEDQAGRLREAVAVFTLDDGAASAASVSAFASAPVRPAARAAAAPSAAKRPPRPAAPVVKPVPLVRPAAAAPMKTAAAASGDDWETF
ncbi:methyl-accepting chemotaxis protein [Paraburkholderia sp. J41]|uniref:methyl-accepting chemotaxis protein n=1 Tax=Paraburkholderia sp. J41 TaxID=2805433 RepID=UPI002AC361F9|nr:methyl-accepting chemotaxis protein [Paraburkholderia sp. J41]